MSDTVVAASLVLDTNDGKQSMKEFRGLLKEAQGDLTAMTEKFGLTSKEAAEAAKRVAALKDQMGDAKTLVDAFNPDRKFAAFSIAVKGITNGFTALQGAMGLVGAESEDLQKTLVKVQSALALSEGVNGLLELKDGFKIIQNVAVGAFNKIKAAIGSTGIGLLVIAIGTLVTYWDDIADTVSGVSDEQEELNKKTQVDLEAQQEKLKSIDAQDNILKLQGKSEKDILKLKIAQTDEVIKTAEISLKNAEITKKAQVDAAKRNKDILTGILKFTTAPLQLVIDTISKASDFLGLGKIDFNVAEKISGLIFDPEEVAKDGQAAIDEARKVLMDLKNQRAGYQLQIMDIDKKAHDEKMKLLDEQQKEESEKIEKWAQEQADLREERRKRERDIEVTEMQERRALQDEETKRQEERNESLSAGLQKYIDNYRGIAQAEREIAEAQEQHRTQKLEAYQTLLNNAADLLGRQTVAGKAMAIASATIDTYQAANSALKANYGIFGPVAQVARFIAVATTIKRGIDNIKSIAAVKVPGGGGSASIGSVSTAGTSAPLTPTPQVSTTQLDQSQINQIGNATVRAFVLESDVTNNQERITRLNRAARLGG